MTGLARLVWQMQTAISCLGIFVALWGLTHHSKCLWKVVTRRKLTAAEGHCPRHAWAAILCIAVVLFGFARLNTIEVLPLGDVVAAFAYTTGMLLLVAVIGFLVWLKGQTGLGKGTTSLNWYTPIPSTPQMVHVLTALVIIVVAFVLVGLVSTGS